MFKQFDTGAAKTKYIFFTGKGGVGKTSLSASLAINLADKGEKILLVSTDPASNLQDIFEAEIGNKPQAVREVSSLFVLNLDPEKAAREYKESVLSMYRGLLPDAALASMDEQLSGSCTVEIAAFNEFAALLSDEKTATDFDRIIFDTAPTGHTLRMLELPAAWNGYIETTGGNASCLGQLSGLTEKKQMYARGAATLKDGTKTALLLVTRPQKLAVAEAARTAEELRELGINNQSVIFNYVLKNRVEGDALSEGFFASQQEVLKNLPRELNAAEKYECFMMPFNIVGTENIRRLLSDKEWEKESSATAAKDADAADFPAKALSFPRLADDLLSSGKKVIFTMGKGGVGKSTIACAVAKGLSERGAKVHLTTTDPAAHLRHMISGNANLRVTEINPKAEIENYRAQIIAEASKTMTAENIDYIKEDLMSPCTEEIAVFKAFADIVAAAGEEIVVIDTAPTGHTLLLLDATQNYAREASRAARKEETSISGLLPRLRDPKTTGVLIVALPEATPYYESVRLKQDLLRAGINCDTFVINNVTAGIKTKDKVLSQRAKGESEWIKRICAEIPNVYISEHKI